MICDGIRINGLHSYNDFDLCIKNRKIGQPIKKSIRDTVPYMNGYYDYTALNGMPCWESRVISYTFDIVADSVEQMDSERNRVLNWLTNAHETVIQDDSIPGYHFIGSYDSDSISEDDTSCELTVEFFCQPFKIANQETVISLSNGANTVHNEGQAVVAHVSATEPGTISLGGYSQSFAANARTELGAMLEHGDNVLEVNCTGSIQLFYTEAII